MHEKCIKNLFILNFIILLYLNYYFVIIFFYKKIKFV